MKFDFQSLETGKQILDTVNSFASNYNITAGVYLKMASGAYDIILEGIKKIRLFAEAQEAERLLNEIRPLLDKSAEIIKELNTGVFDVLKLTSLKNKRNEVYKIQKEILLKRKKEAMNANN